LRLYLCVWQHYESSSEKITTATQGSKKGGRAPGKKSKRTVVIFADYGGILCDYLFPYAEIFR